MNSLPSLGVFKQEYTFQIVDSHTLFFISLTPFICTESKFGNPKNWNIFRKDYNYAQEWENKDLWSNIKRTGIFSFEQKRLSGGYDSTIQMPEGVLETGE